MGLRPFISSLTAERPSLFLEIPVWIENGLEEKRSALSSWGSSLDSSGDILLYGCSVADGTLGIDFVETLSAVTGADVAASTDDTGSAELGGDWVLEHTVGLVETAPIFGASNLEFFGNLLENISGTDDGDLLISNTSENDTLTGGDGDDAYRFEDDWGVDTVIENSGEGTDVLDFALVTTNLLFTVAAGGVVSVTSGTNSVNTVSNVNVLRGGAGDDTFRFQNDWGTNLSIENAGDGSDTLDFSAVTVDLLFTIHAGGAITVTDGTNTLENYNNTENLIGGSGSNSYVFEEGASLSGTRDGIDFTGDDRRRLERR